MLFGVRLRSLFTSRWLALLWAILVLLTALNLVGPQGLRAMTRPLTNGRRAMAATPPGALTVRVLEASIGLVEVFRGFEDKVAGKNLAGRVHR